MTIQQIKWAQKHDWYIRSIRTSTGLIAICRNDSNSDLVSTFTDFQTLTSWAGY